MFRRAVLLAILAASAALSQEKNLAGLDPFVESVMADWKIPGLALAVVKDGQVIHAKGYGYRDTEKKLPVTEKTMFAIGSITKSFTVSAMSTLVEEGKLDWDKRVREYLPGFRLHDPLATELVTPRDLVTHRTGLPRHDLVWYGGSFSREEMIDKLRYLEPSKDFRAVWQYNNIMYMAAGHLAAKVSGLSWEELVKQRLFVPLEMGSSNFSVKDMAKSDDRALGYSNQKDEVKQVPYRNLDEIGPAGSINSNVEEMTRYLRMHMAEGSFNGRQVLAKAQIAQIHGPQMVMPAGPGSQDQKELGHASYGMGFMISGYRGHPEIGHGGGIDGFATQLAWLPQDKVGVVILTNLDRHGGHITISRWVWDRLLGLDPVDWKGRALAEREKAKARAEEAKKKQVSSRKAGTKPSHPVEDYAGEFAHPAYGAVQITAAGGAMKADYHTIRYDLEHFHYDTFEGKDRTRDQEVKLSFLTNQGGDIDRLEIQLEATVKPIVFARVAAKQLSERKLLETYAGQYSFGSMLATVALRGDALRLTVPGQPTYELVPSKEGEFALKGMNGFRVEFKKDTSGAITEMISHQPNGSFSAKRQ